ncbi:protein phosphatase 1 regulatory subunit 15B [Anguilla rostrata]|uniref:protein phosphatase 1 regulatory subunit 15B n=1 Tax=Anguilla rostrata TaxID=7938 RepID=UPI0030D4E0E5
MDTIMEGPERTSDKTAVQRSEGGGMLILPWTKQILCVLWEHLRLLLHVVYYSFLAVFQMFRLEVHLRITDEAGHPRVQHVSASGGPAESFFLNSLFDGSGSVFMPGSGSLSKRGVNTYAGASHAGALLSSFGAEDLCLSLVDDFVIRAQESLSDDTRDDFCLGHHPAWKRNGPADWEVRVTEECQREAEACCSSGRTVKVEEAVPDRDATVEKSDSFWDEEEEEEAGKEFDEKESRALWDSFSKSSDPEAVPDLNAAVEKDDSFWDEEEEEEAGEEFDEKESRALWDSFSKSSDPYNPLSFSACISTSSDNESERNEGGYASEGSDRDSASRSAGDGPAPQPFGRSRPDWVRPGSDSEGDWDSSDDSGGEDDDDEVEEENERLWELFANPLDPYNPLHFTACAASSGSGSSSSSGPKGMEGPVEQDGPPGPQTSRPAPVPSDCAESDGPSCSDEEEEEEEEELWNSFAQSADPYHPLHFRACLQTSPTARDRPKKRGAAAPGLQRARRPKPRLPKRHLKRHCCVQASQEPPRRLTPWKKPGSGPETHLQTAETHGPKKVRFSPLVRVHVMWAWSYAMQAVRRGPWEEMARDRARFQRRIQETEQAIGYCLHQSHREKMLDCLTRRQNMAPVLRL